MSESEKDSAESAKTAFTQNRYVRLFGLGALVFLCNYLAELFFGTSLRWEHCLFLAVCIHALINDFIEYRTAKFLLRWLVFFGTGGLGFCIAWYLKFSDLGIFLMFVVFFGLGTILPVLLTAFDKHHDSADDPADESTPGEN